MRPGVVASVALLAALLTTGCGAAPHSRAAGGVATLSVRPVAWNAANAPVGKVRAVADGGDVVCVFADDGASVFSSGAVVSRDEHVKDWTSASTIYATDGTTRWLVGVDGAGHLHRLRAMSTFEDVTVRYQLGNQRVRGAWIVGPGRVGFLLEKEIALSDASRIVLLASSPFTMFAGGGGFGAGVTKDGIDVVNATNGFVTRFLLPGAEWAALDTKGRLYAATRRAVYAADASGALSLVFDAGNDGIHGLVASGDRVWFADRGELGLVEGDHVAMTSGTNVGSDAKLQPSPSGDVWVIGGGKLDRFTVPAASAPAGPVPAPTSGWASLVAPVFARACASCHQPNGVSGTDLSTEAAWNGKRNLVRERVFVSHTMPPQGHALADADRAALHEWLEAPSRPGMP
jgi:hypothetical protein